MFNIILGTVGAVCLLSVLREILIVPKLEGSEFRRGFLISAGVAMILLAIMEKLAEGSMKLMRILDERGIIDYVPAFCLGIAVLANLGTVVIRFVRNIRKKEKN